MKIILVEDHAALAEMSCRLLRDVYDHEVEHAFCGETALLNARRFDPELMLIDINLPDMDGYELARRIRENVSLEKIVLVALTGWGSLMDGERARAAGFNAYFTKPMDFGVLPTLLRKETSS